MREVYLFPRVSDRFQIFVISKRPDNQLIHRYDLFMRRGTSFRETNKQTREKKRMKTAKILLGLKVYGYRESRQRLFGGVKNIDTVSLLSIYSF